MDTTPAAILQFLRDLPLFAGISPDALAALAQAARLRRVPEETYLFFQDDPAQAVYVVWSGAIAIQLENPDGRELVINEVGPGDCFGEVGVITSQPRSTSAEAITDSVVLLIPRAAFQPVLERESRLALRLLEITARRLAASSQREESLAFHDAQQRLARQLLHQDALVQDRGYLTLSQEELAQRAGLTRQTVATILGRWRRQGWLLTGRGHIVLLDRPALNRLLEEIALPGER